MHSVAAILHQIFIEKAKHYSCIVQKSTKPDKNMTSFITPHQHQVVSHKPVRRCSYYVAVADEHNLNNSRYATFLKSSTKISADLSSVPPTKGAAEQHTFLLWRL
ncbi:hypothetical protein AVEN_66049-1 [Araneus ventricosus]|uniref:Uncharacterized protein n=1 Tax=Araneus ventricosus TaxID=182803 RepID=A0A4Y2JZY1_ARAVE|nr:hypothetical protein AVEN_66049-1 [Araneus ventricosus]